MRPSINPHLCCVRLCTFPLPLSAGERTRRPSPSVKNVKYLKFQKEKKCLKNVAAQAQGRLGTTTDEREGGDKARRKAMARLKQRGPADELSNRDGSSVLLYCLLRASASVVAFTFLHLLFSLSSVFGQSPASLCLLCSPELHIAVFSDTDKGRRPCFRPHRNVENVVRA
jgi:hypothetical protein